MGDAAGFDRAVGHQLDLYQDVHVGVGAVYGQVMMDGTGQENRLVFADTNYNSVFDALEPYTYTDARGYYALGNLTLNTTYTIRQEDPYGIEHGQVPDIPGRGS